MALTDITTAKKIYFSPKTLTGKLVVGAYYVPKLENLPDIFKPFIIQAAIRVLAAGKQAERKDGKR